MERQMAQLAEADRRKDEFLAILAHELRNPLQPLQTAVEVLEHDPDQPVPARIRGIIAAPGPSHHPAGRRSARRRAVQGRQARAAARAGHARRTIVEEAVHVVPDARSTRASTRSRSTAPTPPSSSTAIRCGWSRSCRNLLTNAAKYTEPGRHAPRRAGARGRPTAYVRVTDNGKGIPADAAAPDVRHVRPGARRRSDGAGGLGLGLGLVKRLVELHGGTVRATSAGPGKGSTFELRARARRPRDRSSATPAARHRTGPLDAPAPRGGLSTTPRICASSSPTCCACAATRSPSSRTARPRSR